jgi:hypothetical protein
MEDRTGFLMRGVLYPICSDRIYFFRIFRIMDSVAATLIENCPNYRQKWVMTLVKAVVLFGCETLLFMAGNIGGFVIAYSLV